MTDLSKTIAPKSDQLNADDLIAGPMTITVRGVSANPSSAEQPVSISFEGDNGKPYKPCKQMRRVMVHLWGKDGSQYAGRSMTLYRDHDVQFGGMKVGGIRISHMTGLTKPETMALTATRANRKPFTVQPLKLEERKAPVDDGAKDEARAAAKKGTAQFRAWWVENKAKQASVSDIMDELKTLAADADKVSDTPTAEDMAAAEAAAMAEIERRNRANESA